MTDFLNFLRESIRQVRDIENEAHDLLHNAGDDVGYRAAMQRKARRRNRNCHIAPDSSYERPG